MVTSNVFNYGITKVLYEKKHLDLKLQLVQTLPTMWAILLFKEDCLTQSKCFCWFSDKLKPAIQASARREYKVYKNKLMKDELEYFN